MINVEIPFFPAIPVAIHAFDNNEK